MNTVLNVFNTVWPYLVVGGIITLVTQLVKRAAKLESSAVIRFLFHTVTIVTTATTYLLGNHGISYGLLMLHGAGFSGVANALYPVVKWLDDKIVRIQKALKYVDQGLPALENAVDEAAKASSTTITAVAATNVATGSAVSTPPPADF